MNSAGNDYCNSPCFELGNEKYVRQIPSLYMVIPARLFSFEATNNDSAGISFIVAVFCVLRNLELKGYFVIRLISLFYMQIQ